MKRSSIKIKKKKKCIKTIGPITSTCHIWPIGLSLPNPNNPSADPRNKTNIYIYNCFQKRVMVVSEPLNFYIPLPLVNKFSLFTLVLLLIFSFIPLVTYTVGSENSIIFSKVRSVRSCVHCVWCLGN